MDGKEAAELVKYLYDAFGKPFKQEQAKIYIEHLKPLPYSQVKQGIYSALAQERHFPSIGVLKQYIRESTMQGVANASAYSPSQPRDYSKLRQAVEFQERLISMGEDCYMTWLLTEFKPRREAR